MTPLPLDDATQSLLVRLGAALLVVLVALGLACHGSPLDLCAQALTTLALLALAWRWRGGFALLLVAQLPTVVELVAVVVVYRDYFTAGGMVGVLLPGILQVLALTAVTLWGWRVWGREGGRSRRGASYGVGRREADVR